MLHYCFTVVYPVIFCEKFTKTVNFGGELFDFLIEFSGGKI